MKKVLIGLVVVVLAVCAFVATRPVDYKIERAAMIEASPEMVLANVSDFHKWGAWSPWEKLDPQMKRTFEGAERGVGAKYGWVGNDKVGEGMMEVLAVAPDKVTVSLEFVKPWADKSTIEFSAVADGKGTKATWTMLGKNEGMMEKAMAVMMDMDKMVGPDFEKGLADLKTVAETEAKAAMAAAAAPATAPAPEAAPTQVAAPATP